MLVACQKHITQTNSLSRRFGQKLRTKKGQRRSFTVIHPGLQHLLLKSTAILPHFSLSALISVSAIPFSQKSGQAGVGATLSSIPDLLIFQGLPFYMQVISTSL